MKYIKFMVLAILLLLPKFSCNSKNEELAKSHKIIYLISPPRSLSVAFLRMMDARQDFVIFHEFFQCAYAVKKEPHLEEKYISAAPRTYEEAKNKILSAAKKSPVFAKEMSFAAIEFLPNDLEFLSHQDVHFTFLIRNPHHCIISFYKKMFENYGQTAIDHLLKEKLFCNIFGYKGVYEILMLAKKHAVNPIHVIKSEDLYNNATQTIRTFCDAVDIPFLPKSLSWQNLGQDFNPQIAWHEGKEEKLAHLLHGDAIYSTCFHTPTQYKVDKNGNPTFEEITNTEHKKLCKKAYEENLMYYNKILEEVKTPNVGSLQSKKIDVIPE